MYEEKRTYASNIGEWAMYCVQMSEKHTALHRNKNLLPSTMWTTQAMRLFAATARYGRRAISANTESELLTNLRYRFRNVQDSTFTSTYLDRLTTSTRQRGVNYVLV